MFDNYRGIKMHLAWVSNSSNEVVSTTEPGVQPARRTYSIVCSENGIMIKVGNGRVGRKESSSVIRCAKRAAENRHTVRIFRSLDGQYASRVAGEDLHEERTLNLWTPRRLAQPALN